MKSYLGKTGERDSKRSSGNILNIQHILVEILFNTAPFTMNTCNGKQRIGGVRKKGRNSGALI